MRDHVRDLEAMNRMFAEQMVLLKTEIRDFEAREERSSRLSDTTQYDYLKNVIVRFLETDDLSALLPVLANVLAISPPEIERIKSRRSPKTQKGILGWGTSSK